MNDDTTSSMNDDQSTERALESLQFDYVASVPAGTPTIERQIVLLPGHMKITSTTRTLTDRKTLRALVRDRGIDGRLCVGFPFNDYLVPAGPGRSGRQVKTHRPMRHLVVRFDRAGFAVVRFDRAVWAITIRIDRHVDGNGTPIGLPFVHADATTIIARN